jgi:hypothetical protein
MVARERCRRTDPKIKSNFEHRQVMNTRDDARRYILALPAARQARNAWQHATRLLLDGADAAEVTRQLELALLLDGRLHLS